MQIQSLYLHQFRNYTDTLIKFDNTTTVLIGENGNGKTNILEAIFFLVFGKSFRTIKSKECILWDMPQADIQAKVTNQNQQHKLALQMQPQQKKFWVDDVSVKNFDYLGNFYAVLFTPEDLLMIHGAPKLRRKFIDMLLAQTFHSFAKTLAQYSKLIKTRNKLLMSIREKKSSIDELPFWDQMCIEYGSQILQRRFDLIDYLNESLSSQYSDIAGKQNIVKVVYNSHGIDRNNISASLTEQFKKKQSLDIIKAATTVGPHRDDIAFVLNDHCAEHSASRGECRSLVLALKILEAQFITKHAGTKPVMLLDDVFSELDEYRRSYLLSTLSDQQTIITTTDMFHLEKHECSIYKIYDGGVHL